MLMIHADSHLLRIDRPPKDTAKRAIENVPRFMAIRAAEIHAVRVGVDPSEPRLFSSTSSRRACCRRAHGLGG
jgi:hypothetical protein